MTNPAPPVVVMNHLENGIVSINLRHQWQSQRKCFRSIPGRRELFPIQVEVENFVT